MKKIKVLQVIGGLNMGGAETFIINVLKNINIEKLKELARKGNEILEAKEIKKSEKKVEEKQKIKDAIAKAKATGEKQVINAYSYENNYNECITVYETIDGNGYVTKVKDNAY